MAAYSKMPVGKAVPYILPEVKHVLPGDKQYDEAGRVIKFGGRMNVPAPAIPFGGEEVPLPPAIAPPRPIADRIGGIPAGAVAAPRIYGDLGSPFTTTYETQPLKDAEGRPLQPRFSTIGDETTGLLKEPYMLTETLDPRSMEALRIEALRDPATASRWRTMAQSQGLNQIAATRAGLQSEALGKLAMSGGLRSGARERIASQGAQGGLLAGQNLYSQMALQDEQNRLAMLKGMPAQEIAQAQQLQGTQKTNIQNAINELLQKRGFDLSKYMSSMKEWGAIKTAEGMPSSGGKK